MDEKKYELILPKVNKTVEYIKTVWLLPKGCVMFDYYEFEMLKRFLRKHSINYKNVSNIIVHHQGKGRSKRNYSIDVYFNKSKNHYEEKNHSR